MIKNSINFDDEEKNSDFVYSIENLNKSQNATDKLKTIRPFSELQLLNLHENNYLNQNDTYIEKFLEKTSTISQNSKFFQLLNKLKRRRECFKKCKVKLASLRKKCETDLSQVWEKVNKEIVKKGRCADGKVVEAKHSYSESCFHSSNFNSLEQNLLNIQKTILDDYCLFLYNQEIINSEIELEIDNVLNIEDENEKKEKLENIISSLFAFQRSLVVMDEEFDNLCKNWMIKVVTDYFKNIDLDGRLFLLNHVLRCPPATLNWFASFVNCPNPLSANNHQEAVDTVNFCLALVSIILSPVKQREKFLKVIERKESSIRTSYSNSQNSSVNKDSDAEDDIWHLIDCDNIKGEDIHINESDLTELDIVQLLVQIPFDDILKFLTEGLKNQPEDIEEGFVFGEYSELVIVKLISVSTQIIQLLRKGLITFNCMKFKSLSDYITVMIEKTVNSVSNFWERCKNHFLSNDQALLLRVQVEYDHFILRSVVTILNCQKYGVWKFISVIPFDGITESMIWHIIWVFYNGRDEIDELGGLCPYFSDTYWKSKFSEKSVKVLFKEKLPLLSYNELENLIRVFSNMIESRSNNEESEFVKKISIDIFEMSLFKPLVNEKLINLAIEIFSKLVIKHSYIITTILKHLDTTKKINEHCIKFFSQVTLTKWIPDESVLKLFNKWIYNNLLTSLLSQLSRVILSRLNYQNDEKNNCLFLNASFHQKISLIIYNGIDSHINNNESLEFSCSFLDCSHEQLVHLASIGSSKQFMEWSWRLLLLLKLNPKDKLVKLESPDNYSIPNIYLNNDYVILRKGFDYRNLYSIYICLMMTEVGQKLDSVESNLDLICYLLRNKIYVPALKILEYFIPLHINNLEIIISHVKFNSLFNQLLISEEKFIYDRFISMVKSQLEVIENVDISKKIISFWINLVCNQTITIMKQNQNSWFINSNKGLQHIVYILDELTTNIFENKELRKVAIELISVKSSEMQTHKIVQNNTLTSWLPLNNVNKKCDWTTPLHCLYEKYNLKIYFAYILLKADYLKIEKLWEEILFKLTINSNQVIDQVLKTVCSNFNVTLLPNNLLPVNAWAKLSIDCPIEHPLMPLVLFNFFIYFFANSNNEASLGIRIINRDNLKNIKIKINQLSDLLSKKTMKTIIDDSNDSHIQNLSKLYKAYQLWIDDNHLHDAFVDLDHLPIEYMVDLLKTVFTNKMDLIENFVDYNVIKNDLGKKHKFWLEVTNSKAVEPNLNNENLIKKERLCSFAKFVKLEIPKFVETHKRRNDWKDLFNKDFSIIIEVLKTKIECVMEETKAFDQKLDKLSMLNVNFLSDLTELYKNESKSIKILMICDSEEGCSGPLNEKLEFNETSKNQDKKDLISSNRLDYHYLIEELLQTPSKKVIDCAMCLKFFLSYIDQDENINPSKQLLTYFLSFLSEKEVITFAPSSDIFNLLIESLSLNNIFRDETISYMMMTAIKYPKLNQYFASKLCPANCSTDSFLKMYNLIQNSLYTAPSNVLFVMLSKFDLNVWLKDANKNQAFNMLESLKEALNSLGKNPDNDKLVLLGLYRKHLQLILIYKFPENLLPVFKIMLNGMFNLNFYPILWKDVLLSFGLYLPPNQIPIANLILELKKYASIQPLFTAYDIYSILSIFNEKFCLFSHQNPNAQVLIYFEDYFHSFISVLGALSFIWVNANQNNLSNFNNIWLNSIELWYFWLFPRTELNNVAFDNLNYVWDLFISLIEYYQIKFSPMISTILSLLFKKLAIEFLNLDQSNIKQFKLIQNKALQLNWKLFYPNFEELNLVFNVVNNTQFQSEKFITKIISSIDWLTMFSTIDRINLPKALFYLAYSLIKTSFKINDVMIEKLPFQCIDVLDLKFLSKLVEDNVQIEEYLINQNKSSEMMFFILEMSCFVHSSQKEILEQTFDRITNENDIKHFIEDIQQRRVLYSKTFCDILSNSVKNNSSIYKKYPSELKMFFADFLYRIKIFEKDTSPEHRIQVFEEILPIINSMCLEEARKINLKTLLKNASIGKIYSLNLFSVCCQKIKNKKDFLNVCENSIINLANSNGKIEEISNVFDCETIVPNEFITNSLNENAYLSMYLLYFKLKKNQPSHILLNDLGNFFLQMKLDVNLEPKTFAVWFNLLIELEELLDVKNLDILPFTLRFCKVLNSLTEDSSSSKFLSFIKSTKTNISFKSIFLCLSHAALLLVKIEQVINEEHPNYLEVNSTLQQIITKLQSIRKNKNFADFSMLIEKLINLIESKVDLKEQSIPILKSWLLAYYSDSNYFELMLKEYD